jgi:ferredoxin
VVASGVIDRAGLDEVIAALRDDGYTTIGPTIREGAIVYDELTGTSDLPVGWTDQQAPGGYRLEHRGDGRMFGYVVGPQSWKRFLYPQRNVIWSGVVTADGWETVAQPEPPKYAFIGVRGCELAAIAVQDRVFLAAGDRAADPSYAARRDGVFVVAVNCADPGANCFCTSMGTGPEAGPGYDLVLTETVTDGGVVLLVEAGSDRGEALLASLARGRPAEIADRKRAAETMAAARATVPRTMDTTDIHDLLLGNLEHPHWEAVAARCLGCANCTMVCPTCFCGTVTDELDLDGGTARRMRSWDSCFTLEFSYIHGGSIRQAGSARYRQWLTHKLASWFDQFGTSGCVGCGRCITWCPVGIDLTAEVAAIRAKDLRPAVPVAAAGTEVNL